MAVATGPAKKNRRLKARRVRLLPARTPLAVRRIARAFLAEAGRARRRLNAKGDSEALHDFRVALRRLRSTLRIYRPVVDAHLFAHKWRRRLKRLARASGTARDAEVGLAWLHRERGHMTGLEQAACDRLITEWKARRDEAYAQIRRTLDGEFTELEARLSETFAPRSGFVTAPTLGVVAGPIVREQSAVLATALRRIASAADARAIHAARIEAKRLRYLLEPFAAEVANGKTLLRSLKKLQDEFGELCDRQMLSEELVSAAARYDAERITRRMRSALGDGGTESITGHDTVEGLLALASRLRVQREQYYARVEQRYLSERTQTFLAPYHALADALASTVTASKRKTRTGSAGKPGSSLSLR